MKIHIATLIVLGIILKSTSLSDSSLFLTLPLKLLMVMNVDLSIANLSLKKYACLDRLAPFLEVQVLLEEG